ncbi:hypothetical protein [Streptomyces sp. NPDC017230]|uniref:hypothetical protein n=1 Tax=unclassified Streptomyces TaxID=2593676 RepID=UPI0037AF0C19
MTTETTSHTSSGMHTRLVATAADVISRAMQQGRTLPAALAVALDSARLLQSPDTAAEFEKLLRWHDEDGKAIDAATRLRDELRARIAELEADREANDREYETATARIAALESERHTTNEALSDAAEQLRKDRDRIAELEARLAKPEQSADSRSYPPALPWARLMDADDVEGFLDDLVDAASGTDDLTTLDEVESTIARWRVIGEAQHAHNTAPGPNAVTGGDR